MAFRQGEVVIADDPFTDEDSLRPFIVLNNSSHPHHGKQYISVPLTTQEYDDTIQVPAHRWDRGEPDRPSVAVPWSMTTIISADIQQTVGCIEPELVDEITSESVSYIGSKNAPLKKRTTV